MALTAFLVWLTARWLRWSRSVTGAMLLIVPLGNTSFMGIPLIEALLGTEALPYAILYDQFGTVIALNTYGVLVAAWYGGQKPAWSSLLRSEEHTSELSHVATSYVDLCLQTTNRSM